MSLPQGTINHTATPAGETYQVGQLMLVFFFFFLNLKAEGFLGSDRRAFQPAKINGSQDSQNEITTLEENGMIESKGEKKL